ncbi:MAG: M23 family metallopeptidase [Patescibacteria group bacterium]|nr:M23 family metallopeptidase [Patescibacteria group bacterium]
MAKKDVVTFLSLDLIYTPRGLHESLKWLLGQTDCPFNSPHQAEQTALKLLKAKYGISSREDLLKKGKDFSFSVLNDLRLQAEFQESENFNPNSLVPPQWLRKHWQKQAEEHYLDKNQVRRFVELQNAAWIELVRKRSGLPIGPSEELEQAYREESEKVLSLFQRGISQIEENAISIEEGVNHLLETSLPKAKPQDRRKIEERVLEEINSGIISTETLPSFREELKETVLSSTQALGVDAEKFEQRFQAAAEIPQFEQTFEMVGQSRKTARDIDSIVNRTTLPPPETSSEKQIPPTTLPASAQVIIPQRVYSLPILEWLPTENLKKRTDLPAAAKKAVLFPVVKPLQFLVNISPDNFLKTNPALFYLANYGTTSKDIQDSIESGKPKTSSQFNFLKGLKTDLSLFEQNHTFLSSVFSNYFQAKKKGNRIGFAKSKGRLFSLKTKLFGVFKKTSFGKWIGKGASKLLIKIGLGGLTAGWGTLALGTKKILKKIVKAAGLGYFGLLTAAALKGTGAFLGTVAGGFGGVIGGAILGAKIGASAGVLGGPVGAVVGGAVGLIAGGIAGFFAGSWIEGAIAKQSGISVAGSTSSLMAKSSAAVSSSIPSVVPAVAVGTLAITIVISQITSSAFIVPYSDRVSPWEGQSQFIRVEKSVTFDPGDGSSVELNPEKIENSQLNANARFIYQISITAVGSKLVNVKVSDVLTSTQETGTKKIKSFSFNNNDDIEAGETLVLDEYEVFAWPEGDFKDSIVSNTAVVEATVENTGEEEKSFKSTVLIIGDPPQDCPRGWPISQPFYITQGPGGSFSHSNFEAVDLSYQREIFGKEVRPTHKGVFYSGSDSDYGRYVSVTGTCKTISGRMVTIVSLYAHLNAIYIPIGAEVDPSIIIGTVGNSGISTGPHLHYEFRSANNEIKMQQPYLPINVPRGDTCSSTNHCPSE